MEGFKINTKTTGFGSPARSYVDKRLDTNDLLVKDPYCTFFFVWEGEEKFGIKKGDHLVVDRSIYPDQDDLVLSTEEGKITVAFYRQIDPKKLWGTITWKLSQIKK